MSGFRRSAARHDLALDQHDGLVADRGRRRDRVADERRVERHLHDPVAVAQVDEDQAAEVALRCTQPPSRTLAPTSAARSAPQRRLRSVVASVLLVVVIRLGRFVGAWTWRDAARH